MGRLTLFPASLLPPDSPIGARVLLVVALILTRLACCFHIKVCLSSCMFEDMLFIGPATILTVSSHLPVHVLLEVRPEVAV